MTLRGNWALIPLKAPFEAKSRLSGVLNPNQRARLQQAMLEDLLEGLSGSRLLSGVALYGPRPFRNLDAAPLRVIHLRQSAHVRGLNAAVAEGVGQLVDLGAEIIAVLPGDLPLADGRELDRPIADVMWGGHRAVIPDRWREGTNGLVFRAGAQSRFGFGPDSFRKHLDEAGNVPAKWIKVFELSTFASDIDTSDDLDALRRDQRGFRGWRTRAAIDAMIPLTEANPTSEETCG